MTIFVFKLTNNFLYDNICLNLYTFYSLFNKECGVYMVDGIIDLHVHSKCSDGFDDVKKL